MYLCIIVSVAEWMQLNGNMLRDTEYIWLILDKHLENII